MRLGLVGRGRWGRNIERTLLAFPGVSLTVIGRGPPQPDGLDGVLIASPAATHAELALPYIESGIPTFVEKPMATRPADARRLAEASRRTGAPVFVGHIYLYNPAFLTLLELLPALGPPRYLLCEGLNDSPASTASVLWEWLPHHLSMGRAIFKTEPVSVESWSLGPSAAITRFLFGDVPLVSHAGWSSPIKRRQVVVACRDGRMVFDDAAARKLTLYDAAGRASYPPYADTPPLTRELGCFLDTVRGGVRDRDHLADAEAIVAAIAAAEQSWRERRAVPLLSGGSAAGR